MNKTTRGKVIAYMAALFLAGAATGSLITYHLPRQSDSKPDITADLRARLKTKLDLTPAQQEKIDPLVQKAGAKMTGIRVNSIESFSAALAELNAQIAPELTPEQKEKLAGMDKERQESLKRRFNYTPESAKPKTP
jgi:hypothetical protein